MNSSSYNYNVSSSQIYRVNSSQTATGSVIAVTLGFIINYINGTLIHTFRKHRIFYTNPRYILFIHLVVNDMIQLTTSITLLVLNNIFYKMNASLCLPIIVAAVITTMNTPLNLAVMAVECYIAVCFPLRHAELCTIKRTNILIGCIWALSSVTIVPDIFFYLAADPLWFFYSIATCERDNMFQHTVSLQKRTITYITFLTIVWFTLLFTYFKIFFAAQAANSVDGNAKKARNTILLHGFQLLLCMLTYVAPEVKNYISFLPKYVSEVRFFWYIFVYILPRFISPIVYGLRDKTFKLYLKKNLLFNRVGNKPYSQGNF
ncbi:odorant receptor 131-2-like [Nothobranchius furzeri]|uniref:Olfactory receptor 2AK2-like n=1 Tax=Nothobranchius furzeri TaxID=105023 RepID=A0A9D2XSM5_NOTFU|nr:olfactory receptor 2AK2-like [Nothobranchius furzeri]